VKLHENLSGIRHIHVLDFEIDPTVSHILTFGGLASPVPRRGCSPSACVLQKEIAVAELRHLSLRTVIFRVFGKLIPVQRQLFPESSWESSRGRSCYVTA
jgi:hypothetical protein